MTAACSGTGVALAWPKAQRHVVQIGRELAPTDVAGGRIHVYPCGFGEVAKMAAPYPADPHYDAEAWETGLWSRPGRALAVAFAPARRDPLRRCNSVCRRLRP